MLGGHHALVRRDVRQQLVAKHVADGVDVRMAGLLVFVYADASRREAHARRLQTNVRHVRPPSGCQEYVGGVHRLGCAVRYQGNLKVRVRLFD